MLEPWQYEPCDGEEGMTNNTVDLGERKHSVTQSRRECGEITNREAGDAESVVKCARGVVEVTIWTGLWLRGAQWTKATCVTVQWREKDKGFFTPTSCFHGHWAHLLDRCHRMAFGWR